MTFHGPFLSQMSKHIDALRNQCKGFGKKGLKEQISKAANHINSKPEAVDLPLILDPFFSAVSLDPKHFQSIVLDCFRSVFVNATKDNYPNIELTEKILNSVFKQHKPEMIEQSKLKCIQIISSCFSSFPGILYVHSDFLSQCFHFLLTIHNQSDSSTVREVASMTIQESFRLFIRRYKENPEPPDFESTEKLVQFTVDNLIRNTISIQESEKNVNPSTSISDIDIIVIVKVFTDAIQEHKLHVSTLSVCNESLLILLESDSAFLETQIFKTLLRTDIHVALLSLALDNHTILADSTARLILTCWERFSPFYVEGLNDVLDRGIAVALTSPDQKVIIRSLTIFLTLTSKPQFLVDAFVNYDCDHSGYFRNIYENIVNLIVKYSYPDTTSPEDTLQKTAIKTLIAVLNGLWEYFNKTKDEKEQTEATNFIESKKAKDIFDQGLDLFKRSPMKGINFFIKNKIVEDDPKAIADFLFNTPSIDPAGIGEVIGGSKPLNLKVLPLFVENFDFKDKSFESAFRSFLSKFLIPGEAQMIDRVMEQFGSKFYNDNPQLFSCADTVYVLAFSTLMLHTDAHHPNVTNRMTLEEFVQNNRGIDGGKDLPHSFLESLYHGITTEKINLTAASNVTNTSLLSRKQQISLYKEQCEQTLQTARQRTQVGEQIHQFHRAESPMLVGPMYHSVWGGILGALTMSFEESDEKGIVDMCIKGFSLLMHLASHCYVEDALATIVDSFAKFTRLRMRTEVSTPLKTKNFLCTSALIQCAINDIKYLKGAWSIVLAEISALERMKDNQNVICDMKVVEPLFTKTGDLDRESIMDFIQAMIETSKNELNEEPARIFTLLKFSDVAFYNMNRPMYIWNEIWSYIGDFLSLEGCSSNKTINTTAVDIIRQLSSNFLPLKEMTQFHFQEHFLAPFRSIYEAQTRQYIKEQVLSCVEILCSRYATVLHSGWNVFLRILNFASMESKELKQQAFEILEMIIMNLLDSVRPYTIFLMNVLTSFVRNDTNDQIASQATAHFSLIANSIKYDESDNWICLFQNIGCVATQYSSELMNVRKCAEEILISIVTGHGCMKNDFNEDVWHFFLQNTLIDLIPIQTESEVGKSEASKDEAANSNENLSESQNQNQNQKDQTKPKNKVDGHLIELQLSFHDHLLFKFLDAMKNYRGDVLSFYFHCCHSESDPLRSQSLELLQKYVVAIQDEIKADEKLMKLIIDSLHEIVPKMTNSILFVKVVTELLEIFNREELLQVIGSTIEECAKTPTDRGVHGCWCLSIFNYFKRLIKEERNDEAAEKLKDVLSFYLQNQKIGPIWNKLIVNEMHELKNLNDDAFEKCKSTSLQLICQLIETDSSLVRDSIIDILQRCLAKKINN